MAQRRTIFVYLDSSRGIAVSSLLLAFKELQAEQ
jgi:hypothetical protein